MTMNALDGVQKVAFKESLVRGHGQLNIHRINILVTNWSREVKE